MMVLVFMVLDSGLQVVDRGLWIGDSRWKINGVCHRRRHCCGLHHRRRWVRSVGRIGCAGFGRCRARGNAPSRQATGDWWAVLSGAGSAWSGAVVEWSDVGLGFVCQFWVVLARQASSRCRSIAPQATTASHPGKRASNSSCENACPGFGQITSRGLSIANPLIGTPWVIRILAMVSSLSACTLS